MDWSNEHYVRLYTRDTVTWKRLGWDGQCVLMQLLRVVDRAGTLDLSGLDPWEGVMLQIGAPEDVARRGVDALLRTDTAVVDAGRLVFPAFIEAQECSKSDKQRQKESRDRRAAPGKVFNAARDSIVTIRDSVESRFVTEPSQPVTAGHEPSQPVTSGHSVLCSAVLSNALPTSAVHTDARGPVRVREVPPSAAEIQTRFRGLYLERFNAEPYMGGNAVHTFHERLLGTARARGADPLALLTEAFERWQPKPDDEVAQNAPYAAFAGRFGSLLASQHGGGLSEREQLQADQAAAIKAKDMDRYRSLAAEERRRFGGGGDADAAR